MFSRDWGHYARAAVIVLAVSVYWLMFYSMGASSARNDERAERYTAIYAADAAQQVKKDCAGLAGNALAECAVAVVDATRESQRGESDLGAQWQAANWVLWATLIAGAQLIATIMGLVYIRETLLATVKAVEDTGEATAAMRESNQIMKDANERLLRPYLNFEDAKEPQKGQRFERGGKVPFVFKNFGQTPAKDVRFFLGWQIVQRPVGDRKAPILKGPETFGSLAPGQRIEDKLNNDLLVSEIAQVAAGKALLLRMKLTYEWPGGMDECELNLAMFHDGNSPWEFSQLSTDARQQQ